MLRPQRLQIKTTEFRPMKSDKKETALDRKKNLTIDEIKARKILLKERINTIESKYTQKATLVEGKVRKTLKPVNKIREYPLRSVGISIAVGFVIGTLGRKKSSAPPEKSSSSRPGSGSGSGFTSLLISELKRMVAHKAMVYISDVVDQKVMAKVSPKNAGDPSKRKV